MFDEQKILEKIYYDVDEGFGSARDLYEKARKVDAGKTLAMDSKWMRASRQEPTRTTIPTLHPFRSMNSKST